MTSGQYNTIRNAVKQGLVRHSDSKSHFHGIEIEKEGLGNDRVHLRLKENKNNFELSS